MVMEAYTVIDDNLEVQRILFHRYMQSIRLYTTVALRRAHWVPVPHTNQSKDVRCYQHPG